MTDQKNRPANANTPVVMIPNFTVMPRPPVKSLTKPSRLKIGPDPVKVFALRVDIAQRIYPFNRAKATAA